jgi:hypothetical protein
MNEELKNENEMGINNNPTPEVVNNTSENKAEGQTNNDTDANLNSIGGIGTDLPKEETNNLDFEDFREKKSKKGLVITLIIVLIILLLSIGSFLFIKNKYTASSFLDQSSKNINTFINEVFEGITINKDYLDNIDKYDVISDSNIKLTTASSELKDLNNLEIGLKTNQSLKNNYLDMDISLKQDTGTLTGTLAIDNNKIYIDSKDIINKVLTTKSDEDLFGNVDEYTEKLKSYAKYDIESIANNIVKYSFESLKEANLNTKYNGLNVIYTYEINDTNKDKINDKFMKLVNEDKVLSDIINEDNAITLENVKITIEVKMLNNTVENFTIKSDESEIKGVKIDKNKYKITSDEDEYEVEVTKEKIVINGKDENNNPAQAKIETSDNKAMLVYTTNDMSLDITINSEKKNTSNIEIKINSENIKTNGNLTITSDEKNKTSEISGKLNLSYNDYSITLDIKNNGKYGNNLVTKKNYNNAIDIENVTEEDSLTITTNLMDKISKFKAYNFIQNLTDSIWGNISDDIIENTCQNICPGGEVLSSSTSSCICADGEEIEI